MNLHFQELVPNDFADDSRVWIYQSNRVFTLNETLQIDELLEGFANSWFSHGYKVKGFAKLFFGQFIIVMADENATGVSGCSTDSSVRLIKNIELDYHVDLFDRQLLAFIINERVQLLPLSAFDSSVKENFLSPETFYFNNTVQIKKDLVKNWIIPISKSWLNKKLQKLQSLPIS